MTEEALLPQSKAKLNLDTCFSPQLYSVYHSADSIVVIIDIFRATSAICTAFHYGVEKIIPVASIEEAASYQQQGFLVGAERDAKKIEGFDFGNSPYDYMGNHVKGKTIVLTTTNGTQAIDVAKNAYKVIIGSFLNIDALCNWLIAQDRNVILLCSGWKNKFNLEDALFAGAVTEQISLRCHKFKLGDGCLALKYLFQLGMDNPLKFLNNASHKERLVGMNLKKDIRFCLKTNYTTVLPILKGKYLINCVD